MSYATASGRRAGRNSVRVILTAVGTVLGGIAYSWFEFYLPNLLPKNALTKGSKNPATP